MKNKSSTIKYLMLHIMLLSITASAQDQSDAAAYEEKNLPGNGICISKAEYDQIKARVAASKKILEAEGKLSTEKVAAFGSHSFRWPLAPAKHNHELGYYTINNYVDNDAVSTGIQSGNAGATLEDYNCGERTYDTNDGYDHSGIDIGIGPFGWTAMDNGDVDIVAAEGGYIADKQDGLFDRTCKTGVASIYHGNFVVITHSDGSTTWYMHMKDGSVTTKAIGDYVNRGEVIGKVGSSGNSTGPHLHFEVQDDNGFVRDPFQNGSCPDGLNASLWANEEPYYNKQILTAFTLDAPWTDATCDDAGLSHGYSGTVPYCNHFNAGSIIWFSTAVRDIQSGNTVLLRIYNPSGTMIANYTYTESSSYRTNRLISPLFIVAPNTAGQYKLQITYNGTTRAHYFTVGCPGSITLSSTRSSNYGYISGGNISSSDVIAASARNVKYQAETYIDFTTGFQATNGCEFTAYIDPCTVGSPKLEDVTSATFDFSIMPNPANDEVTIQPLINSDDATCTVQLYNAVGSEVIRSSSENFTDGIRLNTSELDNGVYIINVIVKSLLGETKSTKKLVINH